MFPPTAAMADCRSEASGVISFVPVATHRELQFGTRVARGTHYPRTLTLRPCLIFVGETVVSFVPHLD
jgi:hypothetical protein